MFCDNCGTRVEDGQPFCPQCGKRMGAPAGASAAARPAPRDSYSSRPPVSRPSYGPSGGLLGKFNDMSGLEKIMFPIVCGLLLLNFILIMCPIYTAYSMTAAMGTGYPFWANLFTILFTLSITFLVLDYFDQFSFKFLWIFIAASMALLFILFVILWIDSSVKLTVAGWFFFILQLGLAGCSGFLCMLKLKN